jgi:hypothetical protein
MVFAIGLCLALAAAPATGADLKSAALGAYRARRYAEACALWEKAAQANPEDGAVLADLGLCYQKLGKRQPAVDTSYAAIAKGDEQTRRNAYFNLYTLGAGMKLPEAGKCGALRAPGCSQELFACTFRFHQYGSGGGSAGTGVRIAAARPDATPDEQPEAPLDVTGLEAVQKERPGPVSVIDLLVSETLEDFCRSCDQIENAAEKQRCAARCAKNRIQAGEECAVMAADACIGVIGFVCKGPGAKPAVGEVALEPASGR